MIQAELQKCDVFSGQLTKDVGERVGRDMWSYSARTYAYACWREAGGATTRHSEVVG